MKQKDYDFIEVLGRFAVFEAIWMLLPLFNNKSVIRK